MPPLEDMSLKVIPSMLMDPIEVDILISKGIQNEDDNIQQVAAIRVQEGMPSTEDYWAEPKTGIKFPVSLSPIGCKEGQNDGSLNQVLAGVGARSLNIVKFSFLKIYAFGFYIKMERLRAELGVKYRGVPAEELKTMATFYEDVLRHELDMTLRLIVHHKLVRNGLVRSSFETALRNRLRRMKSNDEEGIKMFSTLLREDLSFPAGLVVDFHWQPGGLFHIKVGDQFIGTIQSLDFCRAFFDIYIGELPVCNKAKQEIGFKLGQMLHNCN